MLIASILPTLILVTDPAQPQEKAPEQPSTVTGEPGKNGPPPPSLEDERAREPWQISVEPGAWFVGAGGRVGMPHTSVGTVDKLDVRDLNLDNPRFVPFGEANIRKGDWRFSLRGFAYDAEKNASGGTGQVGDVVFGASDNLDSSLRFASYELEGAYTFGGHPMNKQADGSYAFDPKWDAVAGVRIYDLNWDIRRTTAGAGPSEASESGVYLHPVVGAKLSMDFGRDFTIDLQMTGGMIPGHSNSSYSLDILVGGQWRPFDHVGVQLGYRSLFFGVKNGRGDSEFSFEGAFQGLYAGMVFRF